MEIQQQKVYVAVGRDVQEGLGTLEWALKNWSSQSISIVIVHVNTSSNDFVYSPYGKLPASSVSDEKLEVYRMYGKEKTDKLLSKYKAFCGKVRSEVLKIEKTEEPVHMVIVGLISTLHVTKFVMGVTCMKSSSRNAKSGISGSFYVHKHKPDFCELFIICGGRLVSLRDATNEKCGEAKEGLVIDDMRKKMKERGSFRGWFEKILPNYGTNNVASNTERGSPSRQSPDEHEKWENCVEEIENYIQWLNLNSTVEEIGEEDGASEHSPMEQTFTEDRDTNMSTPQKIEALKAKMEDSKKMAEEKRNEAKISIEGCKKAEWVISVCNRRDQELEAHVNEQISKQHDLKKELDSRREQIEEASNDFLERQNRLKSALELEGELKGILQVHYSERSRTEAQIEKAATARAEILREIDEMRRQRDVFRRRINFCREREAICMSNDLNYGYREFTMDDLQEATDNFSEHMRIKDGSNGVIYKGKLNHTIMAIKLQNAWSRLSQEEFQAKVNLIRQIRHPHIITFIGVCNDPRSIIFEYAHNRSLQEILFSKTPRKCRNPRSRRKRPALLPWHARIRIASEICSALAFLHATRPTPTPHGQIRPSNVLLDRNLVAKIVDFGTDHEDLDLAIRMDVSDLGILMLQLLTGREDVEGIVEGNGEIWTVEMDERAGDWPLDVVVGFGAIGARCAHVSGRWGRWEEVGMERVMREMDDLRKTVVMWRDGDDGRDDEMDGRDVPGGFLCPILQEVMKQPYIAADGFSYELEAIDQWLRSGHDTSPMINLKLQHTRLTPNHTLRSLIEDWRYNRS